MLGKVTFKMRLNEKGRRAESGEFIMTGQPPRKSVELLVTRQ